MWQGRCLFRVLDILYALIGAMHSTLGHAGSDAGMMSYTRLQRIDRNGEPPVCHLLCGPSTAEMRDYDRGFDAL